MNACEDFGMGGLFYDLTACTGLRAQCRTTQLCVSECPHTFWSFAQSASSDLDQFCDNVTSKQMEDKTLSLTKLVMEGRCPAYLLPSKAVKGRCVFSFTCIV